MPTHNAGWQQPGVERSRVHASDTNVSLTEIVRSATSAAETILAPTACPYPRGSAAAWAWVHVYSAERARMTIEQMVTA